MKKLLSLFLALLMLLASVPALAEAPDVLLKHSAVNLKLFTDAGYRLDYNDMVFTATLEAPEDIMVSGKHNYWISMGIMMRFDGKQCFWFPYLNLRANYRGALTAAYIKAGENRYAIAANQVVDEEDSYRTLAFTAPITSRGLEILRYITTTSYPITMAYDENSPFSLGETELALLRNFLNLCETAGVFTQSVFNNYTDNYYYTLTQFNEN